MGFLLIMTFFAHRTPQVSLSYISPQKNSKGHWQEEFLFYFEYPFFLKYKKKTVLKKFHKKVSRFLKIIPFQPDHTKMKKNLNYDFFKLLFYIIKVFQKPHEKQNQAN